MNIRLVLLSITIVFAVFGKTNGNDSVFGETNGEDSVFGEPIFGESNGDDSDLIFGNTEPHAKHVSVGEQVKQESKQVQAEYQKRAHKLKMDYLKECESSLNSKTVFTPDNYSFCSVVHAVEGFLDGYMEPDCFQILQDVKAELEN